MSSKNRKKIAVMMSGINEEYQRDILDGITEASHRLCYDVYVFTSFGEGIHTHSHDLGEINIFNLPNLEDFDGIIMLSNTIQINAYTDELMSKISSLSIPVVDIDHKIDAVNSFNIEINNEKAMREILEHLINFHGFQRINFICGPKKNPEARMRLKAYKDVLTAHGIPIEDKRIYQGNFVRENGAAAVEYFLSTDLPLPEAIVSANDNMAIAAHVALFRHGLRVPEDVALTGFDNINDARNLIPRLTTVARPLDKVGSLACEIIDKFIKGEDVKQLHELSSVPIFSETCGCSNVKRHDYMDVLYDEYEQNYVLHNYLTSINHMAQSLTENAEMDITEALKPYVNQIDCDAFYVCLCEGWNHIDLDDVDNPQSNEYIIKGYSEMMLVALAYEDGEYHTLDRFPSKQIIPGHIAESPSSDVYIMSPLHFGARCFGYIVTKNGDFPSRSVLYHSWLMNIANYLESNRRQIELRRMVVKLDELHIRDTLTGLYNRRGFFRFASILFDNHSKFSVIFFDLDGFKLINDIHGHDIGDIALKAFATILGSFSSEKVICSRFGGDEFLLFCADYDEEATEKLCENIDHALDLFNQKGTGERNFILQTSYGACIASADNKLSLTECIDSADGRMYRNKYMKKKAKKI